MEYLVTLLCGFRETVVLKDDLAAGIGVLKCLFTLCLLKENFIGLVTSILLDATVRGKEKDNWWVAVTRTLDIVVDTFKMASNQKEMFVVQCVIV